MANKDDSQGRDQAKAKEFDGPSSPRVLTG